MIFILCSCFYKICQQEILQKKKLICWWQKPIDLATYLLMLPVIYKAVDQMHPYEVKPTVLQWYWLTSKKCSICGYFLIFFAKFCIMAGHLKLVLSGVKTLSIIRICTKFILWHKIYFNVMHLINYAKILNSRGPSKFIQLSNFYQILKILAIPIILFNLQCNL